jgi:hypothetical protein
MKQALDLLETASSPEALRKAAARAFKALRAARTCAPALPAQSGAAAALIWRACLGALGGCDEAVRGLSLLQDATPHPPGDGAERPWDEHAAQETARAWLELLGHEDRRGLDGARATVARLRAAQLEGEAPHLGAAQAKGDARPAWELMALYHLARTAEALAEHLSSGLGTQQGAGAPAHELLRTHLLWAARAAARAGLLELETVAQMLARAVPALVACLAAKTNARAANAGHPGVEDKSQ